MVIVQKSRLGRCFVFFFYFSCENWGNSLKATKEFALILSDSCYRRDIGKNVQIKVIREDQKHLTILQRKYSDSRDVAQ